MAGFRSILIVDDEPSIRHVLTLALTGRGYEVRAVSDGEAALRELSAHSYDVVISDVRMPGLDGLSLLKRAIELWPELTFIVMSAYGSADQALGAVAAGAYDYVQKPFKPEEIVLVLRKAEERLRLVNENRRLRSSDGVAALQRLSGESVAIREILRQVQKVAQVPTTVLVTGESGTGKELVARAIHELSSRAALTFQPVNCGAIPAGLVESELFGHARGAFTDARTAKRGLLSEADGGTVFLDEIGELPAAAQVKLLRFLQEGEVRPVGENRAEKVDVRVIAATLRDLGKLVEQGLFREDLYYRLNVVNLRVPPLRERGDDVLLLARAFLARFNREFNRDPPLKGFAPEAEAALATYGWPGNVRELENAVERAVILADGHEVGLQALPERIWSERPRTSGGAHPVGREVAAADSDLSLKRAMRALEESYLRAALKRTGGNRTRAAEVLEISHRALLYKIKEYGIDPDSP